MNNVAIEAFRECAGQFCRWCEDPASDTNRKTAAASWLARLHAAALALPVSEPDNEEGPPTLPKNEMAAAQHNLAPFNGHYYRMVFDPDPMNTDEPVMGDIGDDLLDTYKDVKAGCILFDAGRIRDALWYWSYMHRFHWGQHAVGALAALHAVERGRGG